MKYLKEQENDFSLTFTNISYEVKLLNRAHNEHYYKKILNNITSQAKSKELTAIMGPSGSGKTSLLNFITNRINFPLNSHHTGQMYINSEEIDIQDISNYSSYVMQDDVLFPYLTPKENFRLAVQLKHLVSEDKLEECVEAFLEDLQIFNCKDTYIGNAELKGLSGGERKRVSIGMELVSNPSILFLDEPTSGLDSQTSFKIVSLIKKIAIEKNIIVCCTIHQPSSNIFNLFDKLIIIERGNLVYNENPKNLVDYFASINRPLNKNSNPSDSFMRVLEENGKVSDQELNNSFGSYVSYINRKELEENILSNPSIGSKKKNRQRNYFIEKYKTYSEKIIEDIKYDLNTKKEGINITSKISELASFTESAMILSARAYRIFLRDPMMLKMKIIVFFIFSFLTASVFWMLGGDTYLDVNGKVGFIFFISTKTFLENIVGMVLNFPTEKAILTREYSSKMYKLGPYYLAKNIVETPIFNGFIMMYMIVVYFLCGMRTDEAKYFFIYFAIYFTECLVAQSFAYCIGSLYDNTAQALSMTNVIVLPFILFAGTLINETSTDPWLRWIKYLSPVKYASEAGITNEFENNSDITFQGGWEATLDRLNFTLGIGPCIGILCAYCVVLRIIAFYCLKYMIKKTG